MNERFLSAALATAAALTCFAAPPRAQAQAYTIKTVWSFNGAPDGRLPVGDLSVDSQGNLYGTTQRGGASDLGAIFKYTAATGIATVLASFDGGVNKQQPLNGVVRDTLGNLYGTTINNGSSQGTIFKYTLGTNTLSTLANFTHSTTGDDPRSPLFLDTNGDLYGTTQTGGALGVYGTLFKYNGTAGLTSPASFAFFTSGSHPIGAIATDGQGNFYGAVQQGGPTGHGGLFKYTASNSTLSAPVFFTSASSATTGIVPNAGLVTDGLGNFYGTTSGGGASGSGTLFKYNGTTGFQVLANFNTPTTGLNSRSDMIIDAQGNLYGTTYQGGSAGDLGTVFKYSTAGGLQTLATFNGANGQHPLGALALDGQGNIFGTAYDTGTFGNGTIFELSPTPEPSALAVFAIGALVLSGLAHRRKSVYL